MSAIKKTFIIGLLAVSVLSLAGLSYCEEGELKTYRGTVQEVDFVGSLLTVAGMDEVTFYVPSGTKVIWGVETVGLNELLQNDNVVVKYYDDPLGTPKAAKIILERAYAEF